MRFADSSESEIDKERGNVSMIMSRRSLNHPRHSDQASIFETRQSGNIYRVWKPLYTGRAQYSTHAGEKADYKVTLFAECASAVSYALAVCYTIISYTLEHPRLC